MMIRVGPENEGLMPHILLYWLLQKLLLLLSLGGTGVLWWLYAKQRMSPKETVIPEQLQIAEDNLRALLIYAISATVFTVSTCSGLSGYH
jgi:solute carrier family 44 protein 1 (choline transporter-like protein)